MLNGVVDGNIGGRTGANMALENRPTAGKTGTTNESAAVWFAGYTPQIAAAVWVGDPRGGFPHPLKDVTVHGVSYSQVFGGTLPGPIWRDSMEIALAGTEPLQFDLKLVEGLTTSSLDAPVNGDEGRSFLGDLIADSSNEEPLDRVERSIHQEQLGRWMSYLSDQERQVLNLRFGLEGEERHTLAEIGRMLEVSRERVRQVELKALRKLRHLTRRLPTAM